MSSKVWDKRIHPFPNFAYSAPSRYLNQCLVINKWSLMNKLQWNFNQNTKRFVRENTAKNIVCEITDILSRGRWVNSLRPRLNRHPFADDIFKCIFLNENEWILPRVSLKFVPKVPINSIPALVQIMAWRRPGGKPLFEPMMVSLLMHICVTRSQWVNCKHTRPGPESARCCQHSD